MASRDITPFAEDCTDKFRANAQQHYDQLVALGGRPTRPIKQYPDCKTTTKNSRFHYRDDYENIEVILEVDKGRSSSHWAKEMNKWGRELLQWERFKVAQRIHNQSGRSEIDLELDNTDAALIGALSKLNDWQEFESVHRSEVYEAEGFLERGQQGIARTHNAMVTTTNADAMLEIREPTRGWMRYMNEAQEQLEAYEDELMWVKSQWTDVIAEACLPIAAAPKLQKQLEAKFEKRAKAIYYILQQEGARPSRAVYAPDKDAEFPQKLQHWISESSAFIAELREWRIFMSWRRHVKDAGNTDQEGRTILSEGDSCSELFEDHVKYQQCELDKAASWVESWRRQARKYKEACRSMWPYGGCIMSYHGPRSLSCERDDDDDEDAEDGSEDDEDDDSNAAEAKRAEVFAIRAEEKVSIATKRLEQSKQKLQSILAELALPVTSEAQAAHPTTQLPPTPPTSHSSQSSPNRRRPSEQKGLTGTALRRLKKERVRKGEARMANIDTEQHALPQFHLYSNALKDHDDVEMSDDAENSSPIEINEDLIDTEDTAMSDFEERLNETPPSSPPSLSSSSPPSSPPQSYPRPASDNLYKKLPSPESPCPTSRKTRSATKLDQVPSGRVLKNTSKNKPRKMAKDFTEEQTKALLDAASNGSSPTNPTSLGRNEPEPCAAPTTSTNNEESPKPSPNPQTPIPRKTRSATNLEQIPSSGKILKKSSKEKPLKKGKALTEQQNTALLNAATTSSPSASPILLRRSERLKKKTAAGGRGKV